MYISSPDQVHKFLPTPYIPRDITSRLQLHLSDPEILLLYGPRQVGKSSEIFLLINHILTSLPPCDIFYFNLDSLSEEFSSPQTFLASLQPYRRHPRQPVFVFLDEAQRLENVGLFLKSLYDLKENLKFVVTGSASLEIKEKIREPLTGRKFEFFLGPLTLPEILRSQGLPPQKITAPHPHLTRLLSDYLLYGGYPQVVSLPLPSQKSARLSEIASSYISQDTATTFKIKLPNNLNILAVYLAETIGSLISKEGLSQLTGLTIYELEKILFALEKSFIVKLIPPFVRNRLKEVTRQPKSYFLDLGIRNALLKKLDPPSISPDLGKLFENLVFIHLDQAETRFWRTKNQTEVDFVVRGKENLLDVWETKLSWKSALPPKNLASFTRQYSPSIRRANVITQNTVWKLWQP